MNCKGVYFSDRRILEKRRMKKKDLKFYMIIFFYYYLCYEKMDISIDVKKIVYLNFFLKIKGTFFNYKRDKKYSVELCINLLKLCFQGFV